MIERILLIDDDDITNFLNETTIKRCAFHGEVKVVKNGEEAINFLLSRNPEEYPDLILLDLNMPVMDGFEFLRHFSAIPSTKKTEVVVLSSSQNRYDIENLKKRNIDHFLKPLREKDFQKILSRLENN